MNKEMDRQENQLSRGKFIKLLGVIGAAPIISACERVINPLPTRSGPEATPEVGFTPTSTPTETPESSPTPESTSEPTPTETVEPVNTLTHTEFQSRSDEELKTIAPKPKTHELGFAQGTELVPDTIVRGGEGANYILYKNPQTNNIELAWNAETGTQEHAIYSTYEKEINGEMCTGIPCLFLTDSTVLDESGGGGWLGLDPDFPDAEERLGNAFQAALGFYYYSKIIKPGLITHAFESGLPNFEEISEYKNLRAEFESIENKSTNQSQFYDNNYNKAPASLRVKLAEFMRDYFLLSLNSKKSLHEPIEVTFKAKRGIPVDLTQQKLLVVKFTHSGTYKPGNWLVAVDQKSSTDLRALKFITQSEVATPTFLVDQVRYDRMNYLYGGHLVGFLRYFLGGNLFGSVECKPGWLAPDEMDYDLGNPDYTTGYASILCPPELQSADIQRFYNLRRGLPFFIFNQYSYSLSDPGQKSAIKFHHSAKK